MYPFVGQEALKDCGAASLAMIVKYYHGNMSLKYLNEVLKTNKKGTSAYNLVKAACDIGFDSFGVKYADINKLEGMLLPAIAHLKLENNFYHYVVIYKIDFKKHLITIADPASGIKKIDFSEFEKKWTKVIINFIPIRNIPYMKENSLFNFIFSYLKKNTKTVIYIFIYSLISTILTIIASFYLQTILASLNLINALEHILFIASIFIIIYLFKSITDYFRSNILIKFSSIIDLDLTMDSIKSIIHLPYKYFSNHTTGELAIKINDLLILKNFITKVALDLIINIILSVLSMIVLYFISNQLFIFIVISIMFYFILSFITIKLIKNLVKRSYQDREIANSYLIEILNGYETIINLNMHSNILNKFLMKEYQSINSNELLSRFYIKEQHLKNIFTNLIYVLVIYLGALLIYNKTLMIGSLITFTILFNYFIEPLKIIIDFGLGIEEAKRAYSRISDLFIDKKDANSNYPINGNIEINNLSFAYDDVNLILIDVNMKINQGRKILLIGESGSGKSTILKLLMGYYKVTSNKIIIDGLDINLYGEENIRKYITLVSQNETMFTDSVLNNIELGNQDINKLKKIIKICRLDKARAGNLNLNTLIEENGRNLSGGERERVILARALNKDSSIYLLDEAMSELDFKLERDITKDMFAYFKNETFIVVSHHLANQDLYDNVYKFEGGNIIELYCKK